MTLRFLTAGESHGPCLIAIIEGMPAGLYLSEEQINVDLHRRQGGYGRGQRMKIERDKVEILSGIAKGLTIGAPIALRIENKDWANWKDKDVPPWTVPRPGHADLAGATKYGLGDLRLWPSGPVPARQRPGWRWGQWLSGYSPSSASLLAAT